MADGLEYVVLDAMGVIYRAGDDVGELLIPFLRSKGCTKSAGEIEALYLECSLGNMTSREFWEACGIPYHEQLDEEYIQGHTLTDGLTEFLAAVRSRGIRIACLSNDVREWSVLLRKRHGLERDIEHWLISGDLGVRKPDVEIYRIMLDKLGVKPWACAFLDDRMPNLRVARELGMRVLQFGNRTPDAGEESLDHAATFEEAKKYILDWI